MIEQFQFCINDNVIHIDHNRSMSHPVGQGYLNKEKNFCYVSIPKNCSSTMKSLVPNWEVIDFREAPPSVKFIVILRDPIDRYASAATEFLAGGNGLASSENGFDVNDMDYESFLSFPIVKSWIFNTVYLDPHCLPQSYYLQGIPIDRTFFFNKDFQPIEKIAKICNLNYNSRILNESTSPRKKIITDWIRSQINENPKLEHTINVHYWCDHQLLNSIEIL